MEGPMDGSKKQCQVCYDDLNCTTKTPCHHDEICGLCHLRLRHLHQDKKCPICKTSNEMIVVDDFTNHKLYDDYPIYGTELGSKFIYRDDVGMFFPVTYFEETIQPLFGYRCLEAKCDFDGSNRQQAPNPDAPPTRSKKPVTPLRGLQDHLRTVHRKSLCNLCIDNNRDFISQLPRFTPNQSKNHMNKGDKGTAFRGHPLCEFCRPTRFYDLTQLHAHLNKEHYKCHVCELRDMPNQFFKDYRSLERHFDNQHFLCLNPQCLQARFVVFSNELDLRHHERQVHGGTSSNTKINLEFRVRRSDGTEQEQEVPSEQDFNYSLDGQVFVPDELPSTEDGENRTAANVHSAHAARTQLLMQQAAALREDDAPEAFPTLAAAAAEANGTTGQGPLNTGWSSSGLQSRLGRSNAGEVTEESFPSLPSAPKPTISRVQRQRPIKQNRAISAAAAGWSGASRPGSSASQLGSHGTNSASLTGDNFPSLGASSSSSMYPAARALAQARKPQLNSAEEFPAMGSSSTPYAAANAYARQNRKQQPNTSSVADFPSMGAVNASSKKSVRNKLLANNRPTHAQGFNTLNAANAIRPKITVDDMKASMGAAKYKQLKRYTKEFASGDLIPDSYVDHAASLFDRGYADADFWDFLPALLDSFPNQADARAALNYMDNLKRMQNGASNAESLRTNTPPPPSGAPNWNDAPSLVAEAPVAARTASSGWSNATARGASQAVMRQQPAMRVVQPTKAPRLVAGKKKAAWNGGSNTTVVRAKAPPGSVAVAAANQKPQAGSATKFMAKAQKADNQNQHQQKAGQGQNTSKKKKKKQNKNELRQLAFG